MKHTPRMHARTPLYLALAVSLTAFAAAPACAHTGQPGHQAPSTNAATTQSSQVPPANNSAGNNGKQVAQTKVKTKQSRSQKLKATQLQAITVTGLRASVENALVQKRMSNDIVDVINAQSISQFPAHDIADALQRLPGVIITRSGGEGKTVSLRGLPSGLTLTQLNGEFIANTQAQAGGLSRSFNYLLLPPQLISSVKVYKTPEAKLTMGGIAGTVVLHTRKPLQMPSGKGFVTLKGVELDTFKKVEPRIAAMYSWHTSDDRFGVLVGIGYQKRDVRDYIAHATSWHWWANGDTSASDNATSPTPPVLISGKPVPDPKNVAYWPLGGVTSQSGKTYSGYWMPQQFALDNRTERRRRESSQVTLQFRPTDNFLLTANWFRFNFHNDNINHSMEVPEWGLPTGSYAEQQGRLLSELYFDPSHTIVQGVKYVLPPKGVGCRALVNPVTGAKREPINVCSIQYPWIGGNYNKQEATSQSVNIKGNWSHGILSASFNVGRAWSHGGQQVAFSMRVKPREFVNGQWVNSNRLTMWSMAGKPKVEVSPDVLKNLLSGVGQIDTGSTGAGFGNTKMAQNYAQVDFTLRPSVNWIDSIQFGLKYTDTHGSQNSIAAHWFCPGTNIEYQACSPDAGKLHTQFLLSHSLKTHTKAFTTDVYPATNFAAYYYYLNQRYGPLSTKAEPQNFGGLRAQHEAAYLQLNYEHGPLRGNVGVRWVSVLQDTNIGTEVTTLKQEYYQTKPGPTGKILFCPDSGFNKVGVPCNPGNFQYRPTSLWDIKSVTTTQNFRRYSKVMPSFNIVYSLPHHIQLRGAWSEAMAPPSYGNLLRTGSLTHVTKVYYHDRKQFGARLPGWYGSGGDPNLKAFTAKQYDVAVEWYPMRGAILSIDRYHKKVSNFVIPITTSNLPLNVGGKHIVAKSFSTIGNGKSVTAKGFEFSAQYLSPFGVGVLANYTTNNSSTSAIKVNGVVVGTSKPPGTADYASNLSVFYQTDNFLIRASSTWTGPIVLGLNTGLIAYQQPYNEVDINAGYKLGKHLRFVGSIENVLQSTHRSRIGGGTLLRLDELEYSGRQYYLGVTYKFGS